MHDKHPQDLQKATIAFIKTLRAPASWHSVYGQTRVNRGTGQVEQAIIIHRHPQSGAEFMNRALPAKFADYRIIEADWPIEDQD